MLKMQIFSHGFLASLGYSPLSLPGLALASVTRTPTIFPAVITQFSVGFWQKEEPMDAQRLDTILLPEPLLSAPPAELEDPAEVWSRELIPEAVLPEQFYGPRRGVAHLQSQVALRCAVLDDAIKCYRKQFVPHTRRERRLATEAEAWLFSDDDRWPFSFVNICRALGLEPEYLRRGLKQWRQRPPAGRQGTQRYVMPAGRRFRIAA